MTGQSDTEWHARPTVSSVLRQYLRIHLARFAGVAADYSPQVGIASPKLGMGHRLTHRDAAGGIVLAQRAVGPVGDEEALAIGMEEEAP